MHFRRREKGEERGGRWLTSFPVLAVLDHGREDEDEEDGGILLRGRKVVGKMLGCGDELFRKRGGDG